jgi:hypothetical protein
LELGLGLGFPIKSRGPIRNKGPVRNKGPIRNEKNKQE